MEARQRGWKSGRGRKGRTWRGRVEQGQKEGLEGGWEGVLLALPMTQHTWAVWRDEHRARSLHCEG